MKIIPAMALISLSRFVEFGIPLRSSNDIWNSCQTGGRASAGACAVVVLVLLFLVAPVVVLGSFFFRLVERVLVEDFEAVVFLFLLPLLDLCSELSSSCSSSSSLITSEDASTGLSLRFLELAMSSARMPSSTFAPSAVRASSVCKTP